MGPEVAHPPERVAITTADRSNRISAGWRGLGRACAEDSHAAIGSLARSFGCACVCVCVLVPAPKYAWPNCCASRFQLTPTYPWQLCGGQILVSSVSPLLGDYGDSRTQRNSCTCLRLHPSSSHKDRTVAKTTHNHKSHGKLQSARPSQMRALRQTIQSALGRKTYSLVQQQAPK